ncbi:MAG: hypothetical protein KDK30_16235, partial [Leptospiraceae bacterium]|nr:hypothetical protein [Leptospiraceae bacterium]
QKLKSVTGEEMTANIHRLILLNKLTDELDLETAQVLLKTDLKKVPDIENAALSVDQLNRAIQQAGRFEDRVRQIEMVAEALSFFFALSKLPMIRLVLAPIKVAASMVGALELVGTMEAGYNISKNIKDMKPFTEAFVEREKELLASLASV